MPRENYSFQQLPDADFRERDLRGASFRYSYLHKADFRGALLDDADFYGADLREAKFDGCDHPVGSRTIQPRMARTVMLYVDVTSTVFDVDSGFDKGIEALLNSSVVNNIDYRMPSHEDEDQDDEDEKAELRAEIHRLRRLVARLQSIQTQSIDT